MLVLLWIVDTFGGRLVAVNLGPVTVEVLVLFASLNGDSFFGTAP